MRSSSSAHKAICGFLSALCLLEWSIAAFPCRAGGSEPVLLLKYSSPAIADEKAQADFGSIAAEIEKRLDVVPAPSSRSRVDGSVLPEIDDQALKSIASRVSEAGRRMERLENRDAERQLSGLESELRRYRFGEATRPLLGDVFLKMATISLWEDDAGKAIAYLGKAHALRPGFEPDPALYSPRFRELWAGADRGAAPDAEVLIESVPPGARIFVDRQERGTTPRRMKLPASRPVELRLEHPGYRPSTSTRQWLPGDSERIEVLLAGDREARLAAFLENPGSRIPEAGPIVSEMAGEHGAARIAFLMLDRKPAGEEIRILAASAADPVPRMLGTLRIGESAEGMSAAALGTARLLAGDGWPMRPGGAEVSPARPWYYSWWFLTGVGLLAAGTAVALSGGGGGDGGSATSTSSSDVNF
jgi:hypothetical protein